MTKSLLFTLLLIAPFGVLAQPKPADSCDPFGTLHFKHGKAEVMIRAYYYDIHEAPPPVKPAIRKLRRLQGNNADWGTDITFMLNGCATKFIAPLAYKGDMSKINMDSIYYFTCVIYKSRPGYNTKYFFVVTHVSNKP